MRQKWFVIIICMIMFAAKAGNTTPIPWQHSFYSHLANNEPIRNLIRDFCSNQGINVIISKNVQGTISGQFDKLRPRDFFKRICRAYDLIDYYDGNILYIYTKDELQSKIISLDYLSLKKLKKVLKELKISDKRFPVRGIDSEGIVYVTGPPRYIELVTQTSRMLDTKVKAEEIRKASKEVVRVFFLKYAWADDLTSNFMDKEVVVPGVATLLKNIIAGSIPSTLYEKQQKELAVTLEKLKGKGLSSKGKKLKTDGTNQPVHENRENNQRADKAKMLVKPATFIHADTRLNAVVVKDTADKMPLYKKLIETLDVPAGLVEIRAMIIDINTDYLSELGVQWRVMNKEGDGDRNEAGFNSSTALTPSAPTLVADSGFNYASVISWGAEKFFLGKLKALEENGEAKVFAQPSVLTVNNVEAMIEDSSTFYVRVPGSYEVDLYNVTSGTVLRVTPHIITSKGKKKIKLIVKIEDGSMSQEQVDGIPVVHNRAINTQAVVGENDSLLIGGYSYESHSTRKNHVPVLGKIPILGHLFQYNTKNSQKMQRMFLITPRIASTLRKSGEKPQVTSKLNNHKLNSIKQSTDNSNPEPSID